VGPKPQITPTATAARVEVWRNGSRGMGVAEVQFHEGQGDRQQGITQGDRRVGVGAGIDQDAGALTSGLLDPVHQFALMVALKAAECDPQRRRPLRQALIDLLKAGGAIKTGLTAAQQVEIGAVQHEQMHGGGWLVS